MSWIGALGAVTGAVSSASNIWFNQKNLEEQRKARNTQQAQFQQTMAREDSAMQRRVKDLQLAGLSPTLAAGGAGASSASAPIPISPQRAQNSDPSESIEKLMSIMTAEKNMAVSDSQILLNQANQLKAETDTKLKPGQTAAEIYAMRAKAKKDAEDAITRERERKIAEESGMSEKPSTFAGGILKDLGGVKSGLLDGKGTKAKSDLDKTLGAARKPGDWEKTKIQHKIQKDKWRRGEK